MKKVFFGAIVSVIALAVAGPALGNPTRISKCAEIRNPGSYVLTRNLTAVGDCLVVETNRPVTIDLDGWTIVGDGNTGSGVIARGEHKRNIAVRNGTITNFRLGIDLHSTRGAVVENVRVYGGDVGIGVGSGSTVSNNILAGLGGGGINIGSGSIASGNIVNAGEHAISAGSGSIVTGNVVNSEVGIGAGSFSIVSGNNALSAIVGIAAGVGSAVSGNNVHYFEDDGVEGITVRCPSNVIGNTATGSKENLKLIGEGCTNIDNLAP